MSRSTLLLAASLVLLAATPAAAQEESPAPSAASESAMVRVLHASPDAPDVDVYLDGAPVGDPLAALAFGTLSPYVPVPAGTHAVAVCATADPTVCPIEVPELTVEAGMSYTVAATNALDTIETQVLSDTQTADPATAMVRVVHFAADAPSVDVLTQDGATTVVSALAYPASTEYLGLEPGTYDLKVCATEDETVCPIDPAALDLAAGTAYSVFAIGSLAAGSITAVVAVDASAPAMSPVTSPGASGSPA
jgi:hypothetical protein